jgi:hypothetical protein
MPRQPGVGGVDKVEQLLARAVELEAAAQQLQASRPYPFEALAEWIEIRRLRADRTASRFAAASGVLCGVERRRGAKTRS